MTQPQDSIYQKIFLAKNAPDAVRYKPPSYFIDTDETIFLCEVCHHPLRYIKKDQRFLCDHMNFSWHCWLEDLIEQIKSCLSPSLIKLMQQDVERIRKERRMLGPDDV